MARFFAPDYLFRHYYEITPEFLLSLGIDTVLSDIDNTLAPYEMPEPDERIVEWVGSLKEKGISVALISNNSRERVELFNERLGLAAFYDSGKPGTKKTRMALDMLGGSPSACAVLGDQLLTDVWAARNLGATAIVVPPIKDKRTLFFRIKRAIERPIMKRYLREHGYVSAETVSVSEGGDGDDK